MTKYLHQPEMFNGSGVLYIILSSHLPGKAPPAEAKGCGGGAPKAWKLFGFITKIMDF